MKFKKNTGKQDKKSNSEKSIKKTFATMLELPTEILLNLPLITIIGNEQLSIENYKGVIEYTEEKIRLNTSCGILKVEGKKLFLKEITAESIEVTGKIIKFEYLI